MVQNSSFFGVGCHFWSHWHLPVTQCRNSLPNTPDEGPPVYFWTQRWEAHDLQICLVLLVRKFCTRQFPSHVCLIYVSISLKWKWPPQNSLLILHFHCHSWNFPLWHGKIIYIHILHMYVHTYIYLHTLCVYIGAHTYSTFSLCHFCSAPEFGLC